MTHRGTVVAVVALAALVVGLNAAWMTDDHVPERKPISEQSCRELVQTERDISRRLHKPEHNVFDAFAASAVYADIQAVGRRVERLGGCPAQPSLR